MSPDISDYAELRASVGTLSSALAEVVIRAQDAECRARDLLSSYTKAKSDRDFWTRRAIMSEHMLLHERIDARRALRAAARYVRNCEAHGWRPSPRRTIRVALEAAREGK